MTLKDELLKMKTYEEYMQVKEKYQNNPEYKKLLKDADIICHISDLCPKASNTMQEVFKYPGRRFESLNDEK